jgi:DNA mismatch endonuclease (patch repair protein)
MDVLTKEQRRKNMQAIRNCGTRDEVLLAKALWHRGWRYRKNNKKICGKPDISFAKYRVVVFADSEFFHGKDWETEKYRIKSRREFWWPKIERNMERDREVTKKLTSEGWTVLRFWSKDIRKNTEYCIDIIERELNRNK